MTTVKVHEAKTRLSALLAAVERGERVVIARGDVPVAELVALGPVPKRELGFLAWTVPEDFDAPLAEDQLAAWER